MAYATFSINGREPTGSYMTIDGMGRYPIKRGGRFGIPSGRHTLTVVECDVIGGKVQYYPMYTVTEDFNSDTCIVLNFVVDQNQEFVSMSYKMTSTKTEQQNDLTNSSGNNYSSSSSGYTYSGSSSGYTYSGNTSKKSFGSKIKDFLWCIGDLLLQFLRITAVVIIVLLIITIIGIACERFA